MTIVTEIQELVKVNPGAEIWITEEQAERLAEFVCRGYCTDQSARIFCLNSMRLGRFEYQGAKIRVLTGAIQEVILPLA